jgi:hypothetical protein
MQKDDFVIGQQFWCAGRRWRCTDIGTRVIVAISLEPREMVEMSRDPEDKTKYTKRQFLSDDPRDLNGPPYGVVESVFDEYSMEACSRSKEEEDERFPE